MKLRSKQNISILLVTFIGVLASGCQPESISAPSQAPDATDVGPYATSSAEYRLSPSQDGEVLVSDPTEVWGQLYRPTDLGNQPHPLLVFLHGNHPTCGHGENPRIDDSCEYTFTGSCPAGKVVVPSHLGFEYLAERLASWGYVVVSINSNLGINCGTPILDEDKGLILARGKLVLRHLAWLAQWNRDGGAPASLGFDLKGKLDLLQIGLFGHSRGGEGMRAAFNLYQDAQSPWPTRIGNPLSIRGIFEIAPTDGQSARDLEAIGTAWNVLLPMCDGDLPSLPGMKPFDRMQKTESESDALSKSMYAVWGANHNYFNTEWQTSDSPGCFDNQPLWNGTMGSPNQRETALSSAVAFFRAHVGVERDPSFGKNFDPLFALPWAVTEVARIERAFMPAPSNHHQFGIETAFATNSSAGVTLTQISPPEHDASLQASRISWATRGSHVYFQDGWANQGRALSLSDYETLDFRISRAESSLNSHEPTDFEIQLVLSDGTLSPSVALSRYTTLIGPVGAPDHLHSILESIRVPLQVFGSPKFALGVRFTFSGSASGEIYLTPAVLAVKGATPWAPPKIQSSLSSTSQMRTSNSQTALLSPPPIPSGRITRAEMRADIATRVLEFEVESADPMPVQDALPMLTANGREVAIGVFPRSGDLHHMVFRLDPQAFGALPDELDLRIVHREDPGHAVRDLGRIRRSSLPLTSR